MQDSTAQQPPLEVEDLISIPPTVYVACPKKTGLHTRVDKCPDCPHWAGVGDRFPGAAPMAFSARYTLKCAHPVNRPMLEIDE